MKEGGRAIFDCIFLYDFERVLQERFLLCRQPLHFGLDQLD